MDNFELTLKLTVADAQIILAALGKMPMENVLDVWSKIKGQAESQIAAARVANDETQAEAPPAAA